MARERIGEILGLPVYVDGSLPEDKWYIGYPASSVGMDLVTMTEIISLASNIVDAAYGKDGRAVGPIGFAWAALGSLRKLKLLLGNIGEL